MLTSDDILFSKKLRISWGANSMTLLFLERYFSAFAPFSITKKIPKGYTLILKFVLDVVGNGHVFFHQIISGEAWDHRFLP